MVAVAVGKKVVGIDHFLTKLFFQSLQIILFFRSNQGQLIVCIDSTENQRKIGLIQMS